MKNTETEYTDILNMKYPFEDDQSKRRPRMSNAERAKIFAPFSALKGHDEAILEKQKKHLQKDAFHLQ